MHFQSVLMLGMGRGSFICRREYLLARNLIDNGWRGEHDEIAGKGHGLVTKQRKMPLPGVSGAPPPVISQLKLKLYLHYTHVRLLYEVLSWATSSQGA